MPKKYRIGVTHEERESLEGIRRCGKVAALKQRHARILLLADENAQQGGASDEAIAAAVAVRSVERARQSFVEEGLEAAMQRKAADRTYAWACLGKVDTKSGGLGVMFESLVFEGHR
jgi:hypothetical protein